ncbi:hypothetical protein D9613_004104 [Agrocybe pediades]|uniref:Uncharacterized protein n=1 Tax=Agrocybe pediades TaxID=84607 RepID=A0A8H4QJ44_9AGAR|nr:hypothetical protein D9613_004104 [Agrocybe pediades]
MSSDFTLGSLYLAAFAQATSPHIGLIVPVSEGTGHLVHLRMERESMNGWVFEEKTENLSGNIFLTSLLKIHDIHTGNMTIEKLTEVAKKLPVPANDFREECGVWACRLIEELHNSGMVNLTSVRDLRKEIDDFAAGNRQFMQRNKLPNVAVSKWCS